MSHKVFASDTPFSLVEAAEFQNYLSHFFTNDLKQSTLFSPPIYSLFEFELSGYQPNFDINQHETLTRRN